MTLSKAQTRQGRLGGRKSNDGCKTCKIRKVKCDELRPACRRCLETGRKCDGYVREGSMGPSPPRTNSAIVHMKHPTTYAKFEQVEVQSFEFFIRRVVPGSTQLVVKRFWHQIVPQLSHSDPVIWDAVIALSCLAQHPQYSNRMMGPWMMRPDRKNIPVVDADHRRALTWYSKSIAGLRKRMKQTTNRSATAVISCILYICIECLQDNFPEAISLYERAVDLMGLNVDNADSTRPTIQFDSYVDAAVRSLLDNMATSHRLPIQRKKIPQRDGATFQSLSDAKEELFMLFFAVYEFILENTDHGFKPKDWLPSPELIAQQQNLLARFPKWHLALENMTNSRGTVARRYEDDEDELRSNLLVAYGHYFILLSTCFSMYETAYDELIPLFQNMVDHASRVVRRQGQEPRPVFIFETRVVPTLFFVATKCRHPIVRRQAISLLRNGAQIENTWKADTLADLAERMTGIEESGDVAGTFRPEPDPSELPPECNRVYRDQVYRHQIMELEDADSRLAHFHQFERWRQDEHNAWFLTQHIIRL